MHNQNDNMMITCRKLWKQKNQNQNFATYGIDGEISLVVLVFVLDYFHEKLGSKFFKKSKKP